MAAEWRQERACGTAAYRLEISGAAQVRLEDGQGRRYVPGAKKLPHELSWYGGWMVESIGGDEVREVGLRRRFPAERPLRIEFEGGPAEQVMIHRLQTPPEARIYRGVTGVTIAEDQTICVECRDEANQPTFENRQPGGIPQERLDGLASELEEVRRSLAAAQDELAAERQAKDQMQELLAARGEELVAKLVQEKERLSEALTGKLAQARAVQEEAQGLRARVEEAECQGWEAEQERAVLQKQLEEAEGRLEVKTLDCEQARADLGGLRAQMDDDWDTLTLMEEEPFLTGNSVYRTLEEITRKMEAAERRLGQIIALRGKINDTVQQAITRGDGGLPLNSELGGEPDGPDGHEWADSSAGGADPKPES